MALFRSACTDAAVSNLMADNNRIAFARDNKGYFALNNGGGNWQLTVQTTLPSGTYCDVYGGALNGGSCSGASINVGSDGKLNWFICIKTVTDFRKSFDKCAEWSSRCLSRQLANRWGSFAANHPPQLADHCRFLEKKYSPWTESVHQRWQLART
jgi:hypothetical protein